jgi:plastocyanin
VEAGTYTVAVTPPSGYSLGSGSGTTTVAVVAGQQAGVAVIQLTKQAPGGPAPLLAEVSMANTAFNPQSVEVRVGGSVRWTNNDNTAHNATGAGFTSTGNMNPGAAIERQMDTAGTFQYSCTLHAGMNGTIVVR